MNTLDLFLRRIAYLTTFFIALALSLSVVAAIVSQLALWQILGWISLTFLIAAALLVKLYLWLAG